ncbi:hypothetical protein FA13DRAFT_377494 [Coprinellus micaceus]|uniref:Uncharacterized protein n=1 Tax=Coprinellus micaceus TaxID=71717 RepID=A0A4Y7SCC2_COPMI|nr:hypothetical protein FA13DRAFT_377494 [Coprinellus micaceus]
MGPISRKLVGTPLKATPERPFEVRHTSTVLVVYAASAELLEGFHRETTPNALWRSKYTRSFDHGSTRRSGHRNSPRWSLPHGARSQCLFATTWRRETDLKVDKLITFTFALPRLGDEMKIRLNGKALSDKGLQSVWAAERKGDGWERNYGSPTYQGTFFLPFLPFRPPFLLIASLGLRGLLVTSGSLYICPTLHFFPLGLLPSLTPSDIIPHSQRPFLTEPRHREVLQAPSHLYDSELAGPRSRACWPGPMLPTSSSGSLGPSTLPRHSVRRALEDLSTASVLFHPKPLHKQRAIRYGAVSDHPPRHAYSPLHGYIEAVSPASTYAYWSSTVSTHYLSGPISTERGGGRAAGGGSSRFPDQ